MSDAHRHSLSDTDRAFLDSGEFAVLATVDQDGSPQSSVVWLRTDGPDLLISTVQGRRKEGNLRRDPRASVLVYSRSDPTTYLEVRGTVTITPDGGRELIDELARRYTGVERFAGDDGLERTRVVLRLTPTRIVRYVD
jgi:PPOX class probable F420-dependent enzyme